MKPSEKDITLSIIQYLNYTGDYWVWRENVGASKMMNKTGKERLVRFGKPGVSDILGIQRSTGRFVAFEVKTPERKKNVTVQQQNFLFMVTAYGGIGAVVTSIDDVKEALK